MLYFQSKGPYQDENLLEEMYLVHLATGEDKTSEGFTVLFLQFNDVTWNSELKFSAS